MSARSFAQTQPIAATIDASKTGAPISRYIYGQFLEHIGGIVNNGILAEMLDDRKFYYPITSHPPAEPASPARFRRRPLLHWTPIGPDEFVTLSVMAEIQFGKVCKALKDAEADKRSIRSVLHDLFTKVCARSPRAALN